MVHHFEPTPEFQLENGLYRTPLEGLFYLPHNKFADHRGFYSELNRIPELEEVTGEKFTVKQMNLSYSTQNVIRGIHAENWNKLLTIIDGLCFCAWADLRPESKTFGDVVTMTVGNDDEGLFGSVFVSAGIGNSFCVLKGPAHYLYAVDQLYAERDTSHDVAINLFDEDLAIDWPLPKSKVVMSDRDRDSISLRTKFPEKF